MTRLFIVWSIIFELRQMIGTRRIVMLLQNYRGTIAHSYTVACSTIMVGKSLMSTCSCDPKSTTRTASTSTIPS